MIRTRARLPGYNPHLGPIALEQIHKMAPDETRATTDQNNLRLNHSLLAGEHYVTLFVSIIVVAESR